MSTTNSIRGRCAGSEPRLIRRFSAVQLLRPEPTGPLPPHRSAAVCSTSSRPSSIFGQRLSPAAKTMPLQFLRKISERLDIVPAQFRVLVTIRPKYACRRCEDSVVQAPAPARLIEGGMPTEATIAQVLVSKYADHLPLYRQAQIYARQQIVLDTFDQRPSQSRY